MRLDIRIKDDPEQQTKCFVADITLDGVLQKAALMGDEETGELLRFKQWPNGNLVINHETGDAETELLKGVVVITLPGEAVSDFKKLTSGFKEH